MDTNSHPIPNLPPLSTELKDMHYIAYPSELSYIEEYAPPKGWPNSQVRGCSWCFGDLVRQENGRQVLIDALEEMRVTVLKWYDEYVREEGEGG